MVPFAKMAGNRAKLPGEQGNLNREALEKKLIWDRPIRRKAAELFPPQTNAS
jgi:hypothetical protein